MTTPAHAQPDPDKVVYCGAHDDTSGAGPVWLEDGSGGNVGLLAHPPQPGTSTPTDFSWGYGGAGPAELARAMLVDALGEAGHCPGCAGLRFVVFLPGSPLDAEPVPYTEQVRAELDRTGASAEGATPLTCWHCEGTGTALLPFQDFKDEVVAQLDQEWTLTRTEVREWYRAHLEKTGPRA